MPDSKNTIMPYFLFAFTKCPAEIKTSCKSLTIKINYTKEIKDSCNKGGCLIELSELMKDYEINYAISVMPKNEGKEEIKKELKDLIQGLQERLNEIESEEKEVCQN